MTDHLGSAAAGRGQLRAASGLCLAALGLAALGLTALGLTLMLLPFATSPGPVLPGFVLINQSLLVTAYGLSVWVLFTQFRRAGTWPLLLVAA